MKPVATLALIEAATALPIVSRLVVPAAGTGVLLRSSMVRAVEQRDRDGGDAVRPREVREDRVGLQCAPEEDSADRSVAVLVVEPSYIFSPMAK